MKSPNPIFYGTRAVRGRLILLYHLSNPSRWVPQPNARIAVTFTTSFDREPVGHVQIEEKRCLVSDAPRELTVNLRPLARSPKAISG
jgi:hypothetical protein